MKPVDVTFFTRANCSLCKKAKAAVLGSGVGVRLTEIDIDSDPELLRRFTNDVPVVYIDGVEAFRHHVDPAAFVAYAIERRRNRMTSSSSLAHEKCVPCRGGVPPLRAEEANELLAELGDGWRVVENHHLEKEFTFPDFAQALAFTNRVGAVAEEEGHHPDVHLAWGKARVTIWTHKIDGLTRSDFVLAAKIDRTIDNRQLIVQAFEELAKANSRPLVALFADDVTWRVMGQTPWSRTYRGKSAVLGELLRELAARLGGPYKATAENVIAEGPYVVVQARGDATTKLGARYDNEYCFVYRMENGKIAEVTEYLDTELVTRALGAV